MFDATIESYNGVVNFFKGGGFFMIPIALVLAIGFAIAIERWLYLNNAKLKNRKLLSKALPLMQSGDYQQVYTLTSRSEHAIAKILTQGLAKFKAAENRDDIEAAMEESMLEVIPRLEKRTHYLAMFANIATLLGLLGTIIGLIDAFTAVQAVDPATKAAVLSGSISKAMNTTAFGLMVAIPLLFAYTVLQTKTTQIVDSLEMATVKFVNLMAHRKKQ